MHKFLNKLLLILMIAGLLVSMNQPISAKSNERAKNKSLKKTATIGQYDTFDINRIFCYVENDGTIMTDDNPVGFAMQWPGQSGITINYNTGIWVIGKVNGEIRSAAAEYSSEFSPGPVLNWDPNNPTVAGVADNPSLDKNRIYKIRYDSPLELTRANFATDAEFESYQRCREDYLNWPVSEGAPVDKDGKPSLIGDQVLWYVCNDFDPGSHQLWGTAPLGLELQVTVWGYRRADQLGDMMFAKFIIINKGGNNIDSAYVSIFDDIDLGFSNDDFVGCDTTLSLGFNWNAGVDASYGVACPSIGIDFFQGPIVPAPGQTAYVSGRYVPGYKNLPMTSFAKYIRGGGNDYGDPETAPESYYYMQGLNRVGNSVIDPITGQATKFVHPGDPVTGQGWIDPMTHSPSDRRFLMTSGPITIAPGDTQEVVICCLIAQGADAKTSVTALKFADRMAQYAYDQNFNLPKPPEPPKVKVTELDQSVVLTWESNAEAVENYNTKGYEFQGYNIYQGASSTGPWRRIQTFDIVDNNLIIFDEQLSSQYGVVINQPVAFGQDNGIQHFLEITTDQINQGIPLKNWRKYYFAVTAYGYGPENTPKILESAQDSIIVIPHPAKSGYAFSTMYGDTLGSVQLNGLKAANHSKGSADASVYPVIVDPDAVKGHSYKITFGSDTTRTNDTTYTVNNYWNLFNTTLNQLVLPKQTNLTGDNDYTIVDGIIFKVAGSFEAPTVPLGEEVVLPAANTDNYDISNYTEFGDATALATESYGAGSSDVSLLQDDYEFRFTGEYENPTADIVYVKEGTGSIATFVGARNYSTGDHPMNPAPGSENYFTMRIPFEVWNVSKNQQVNIIIFDRIQTAIDRPFYAFNPNDRVYAWLMNKPYQETATDPDGADAEFLTWDVVFWEAHWQQGDVVRLSYANPLIAGLDEYTIETTAPTTGDLTLAKSQAELINVYPNPYFGQNVMERIPTSRFITFTHLPEEATIRIFNLAGEFIQTIEHTSGSIERWNLRNSAGIPIASGIYLVHIEMKDIGNKILKLAVFSPEERLDVW
ncbi:T9SS type A sorting domain-containing protein [candidate division KSB1 bacterium]|nr:T9SS type A sorting domain-containing protein [candidate division KSB1 bacterium]